VSAWLRADYGSLVQIECKLASSGVVLTTMTWHFEIRFITFYQQWKDRFRVVHLITSYPPLFSPKVESMANSGESVTTAPAIRIVGEYDNRLDLLVSSPATLPQASAAPTPAPPFSVTTPLHSQAMPNQLLGILRDSRMYPLSHGLSFSVVATLVDFFTTGYKLASSNPQHFGTRKSLLQCWRIYR